MARQEGKNLPAVISIEGRQNMSHLEVRCSSVRVHADGGDAVQAQEDQVHEIVLRESLGLQVSVHQAQPPQTPPPSTALGQIRYEQRPGASHQYHLHRTVTSDEKTQLASCFEG